MMNPRFRKLLGGAGLIAAGLFAGLVLSIQFDLGDNVTVSNDAAASPDAATAIPESPFVAVADDVVPGVVAISTRGERDRDAMRRFHPWGDMFDDLFPNDPRQEQPEESPRGRRQRGAGSGFFLDFEDGYLMTNNHVINNASEVTVTLSDGTELDAKIVGQDDATDVAVLQVNPDDYKGALPSIRRGNSEDLRVGEWVLAVGNPFGQLAGSVTVGVVSALHRADLQIMGNTPAYQNFIQTDASINFGNSGGPLINIRGEVVGMNTAINPAGQGIGFAIPINLAHKIAEELIANGKVVRGFLGIVPQGLTPEIAESFGVDEDEGILIGQVLEDTPAAEAGLETGDIITRMNNRTVSDVNAFRMEVADQRVGDVIRLEILRDGKAKNINVELAERPGAVVASSRGAEP
ncbi:MAG TPA: trypsin-like peptidase domain-containing protein, partial [bacterium]|nr:trypsin-like peptidase domain-containing protein [bacterium]